ncbi:unnamed protein product, partial [Discosporangium mesarthrocarpum]
MVAEAGLGSGLGLGLGLGCGSGKSLTNGGLGPGSGLLQERVTDRGGMINKGKSSQGNRDGDNGLRSREVWSQPLNDSIDGPSSRDSAAGELGERGRAVVADVTEALLAQPWPKELVLPLLVTFGEVSGLVDSLDE